MGFLKKLFNAVVSAGLDFKPDFSKTEYENWLDFLSKGGTTKEWEYLLKINNWRFQPSEVDAFIVFEQKFRPISNEYFSGAQKISEAWSIMYNLKDYTGKRADLFVDMCLDNIKIFKAMFECENEYGQSHLRSVEGYKRLAMLYEKQGRFEEAAAICKEAILYGVDECSRLARMIRKAGRAPSAEEAAALTCFENAAAIDG